MVSKSRAYFLHFWTKKLSWPTFSRVLGCCCWRKDVIFKDQSYKMFYTSEHIKDNVLKCQCYLFWRSFITCSWNASDLNCLWLDVIIDLYFLCTAPCSINTNCTCHYIDLKINIKIPNHKWWKHVDNNDDHLNNGHSWCYLWQFYGNH